MMKPFNKTFNQSLDRLIDKLADAYQSKAADARHASEKWQENVMRSVRQIGTIDANNNRERFGHLSWRLTPVAVALLIIMTLWIARVDDSLEFQIASLVVSDPVQTDVYNPF